MINLLGFITSNHHKYLTFQIFLYTAIYRFLIYFVPIKYLKKHFGVENEESPDTESIEHYKYAKMVSVYVNRSADNTIWESKCLVRALTAKRLLKKKKIACTLYLGVGKDNEKMIAHAWLRCGNFPVTGGDGSSYATVAKYKTQE